MTTYRILEKKGKTIKGRDMYDVYVERYIPRYIVQSATYPGWKDLKEFTSLEEAIRFKRDLELEEGRAVE